MGNVIENILGKELLPIYDKVQNQQRLTAQDALLLYQTHNLNGIGYLANLVRERLHQDKTYFVSNQHINYTNICNKFCKFCGFYAKKGGPLPYEMDLETIRERLTRYQALPISEIHVVGGINPRLPYNYYIELIQTIKQARPEVHVKAFTAVEIEQIASVGKVTIETALQDLKHAGLDSLPGGGIEILSDRVHKELFGKKINGEAWKNVARAAAQLNIPQYATMLYGHIETIEERIQHLIQMRELQDETKHFLAMTPLSFHPEGTDLADLPSPTGKNDLRNIAITRLMLDNFQHIKSFWIMNTAELTQLALWYGADDADGLIQEYEITYKQGEYGNKQQALTYSKMVEMITEAKRTPVERDALYNPIQNHKNQGGKQFLKVKL